MDPEKEKKKEKFVPCTENEVQFDRVLYALSEWVKTGIVDIDMDLDGDIDINLPDESGELLGSQLVKDLPRENVVGIIEYEIPALLSAGLSDDAKDWLIKSLPDKILKNIDAIAERSKKVLKTLGSEELKHRSLLRKITSGYVVQSISCKHSTYHHRKKTRERIDIPYVTLEITFSKPHSKMMISFDPERRVMVGRRSEEIIITLDLHKRELENLVKRFKTILENEYE